ncbi:UDP-N-acetylglucosamine 1-carboxyvinyltransferase [Nakamurella sp. A5-74]|uniref:UDP-N-acetylglucosamine 1-carboxyvinyltransferase n=1 Tax=Nakamurella sp. A5-74 TaxID=3158264 RepID=A0AAU8DL01_9ACTN
MSERFLVTGGARLDGEVTVAGAKNSVLKLMAATLLAEGTSTITNCPDILDVPLMADVLRGLGCTVTQDGNRWSITTPAELSWEADFDAVRRFRASVCVLGPLMGRCLRAKVALPGGDAIGSRPLDMHQAGLEALGARMRIEHGAVVGEADALIGAPVELAFPSVGATENILMAAVLAKGTTTIDNVAREPEIVDLVEMLQQMGAQISGAGTSTMTVEGVEKLHPVEHVTVGDRMVAGTWAYAAAVTRGAIRVHGTSASHLAAPLERLAAMGVTVRPENDGFSVDAPDRPRAVDFITLPFPGFPTDLQPMALAVAAVADGHSMITENVFEARFKFVDELVRMGADARIDGHHASVRGRERLSSTPVWATDIRAGAGLVLAGMAADGVTEVNEVWHIDRGYPRFVEDLVALGAQVERVTD